MFATSFLFIDCGFIIPQDKVFFCDEVTLIKKSGAFGAPDFKKVNYAFHIGRYISRIFWSRFTIKQTPLISKMSYSSCGITILQVQHASDDIQFDICY